MKPQPGDRVKIKTKKGEQEGTVMPSAQASTLLLKLDNGYNVGIHVKDITSTKILGKHKPTSKKTKQVKQNTKLPKISILHTGGTIASKVDYKTGAVIARFTPAEILQMFPELLTIAQIDSKLIRNMWSGDMRFAHHNIMANAVAAEVKKGVKGIIITHGTDTLGYTAAALSFILENCPIPVILVGAQRSSDRGSSDAGINLIAAAQFITETDFAGVAICMHENMDDNNCLILPATKTRKMHSSRRDAFKAINSRPIARVKKDGSVEKISKHAQPKGTFTVKSIEENLKIGLLSFHPNMFAQEIENYSNFDGLILQGTGLGNGPVDVIDNKTKEHDKILKTLIKLAKKIPLVMTTQCLFGRVQMDVYAYGRKLQDAGIIGNHTDMLPETAFIKLAWLLSNHKKDAKKLMTENLRGEISKRIDAEEEFL